MSAENVRAILFKTLTDSDFYNLMLTNAGEALKGYDLTDDERRVLTVPDKNLYKMLGGAPPSLIVLWWNRPSPSLKEDDEKIVQLINSIQNSIGEDRFNKIIQLSQQIQEQNQIRSDPPQNE
jgi:hypothetical protein